MTNVEGRFADVENARGIDRHAEKPLK